MINTIKTFEEMNETERREYLEGLIEDYVLADQDGNAVSTEEFLKEVPVEKILKYRRRRKRHSKAQNRDYFTRREIAEKTGRHPDTIGKLFCNNPGVKNDTHAGRTRSTHLTLLISQ